MRPAAMKYLLIMMLMLFFCLLSGCWNRREPDSLAIVNSVLNDTENGMLSITFEVLEASPQSKSSAGGGGVSSYYVHSEADTLPEALRIATTTLDRKIYIGHIETRFISEKLASTDIFPMMDFYLRDHEARQDAYVVIIKGDNPDQIYQCSPGMSDTLGSYISQMAKNQSASQSVFVTTLDFLKDYYNDGKQPVAGVAEIVESSGLGGKGGGSGGESSGSGGKSGSSGGESGSDSGGGQQLQYELKCSGLAAFKEHQLVGYMDGIETRAYNFVVGKFKSAMISVQSSSEEGISAIDVIEAKPTIKVAYEEGQAKIDILVKINGNIILESDERDLRKNEVVRKIEKDFENLIKSQIFDTVTKAQKEFKSDIFGFGTKMHIQHPKQWKKIKGRWDDIFSNAAVTVSADVHITGIGEIKESFLLED